MWQTIREDIRTVFAKDPAARSVLEVLLCYPGLHALWGYRVAHFLWQHKLKLPARMVSQCSRFFTGIEIHPAARIGRRLFIDHGALVVIGETAEIGDDVLLYQGVTLGGTTLEKKKRHPTLGNSVVMESGSVALGPITIGDRVRIGSGAVVVRPVPPGATVVGIPGRIATERHKHLLDLEHGKLPDPIAQALRVVTHEQHQLEERLKSLEIHYGVSHLEEEKKKK